MGLLPVRWLPRLLFPAALLLLFAMWHYTNQLNEGAFDVRHEDPPPNVRIIEVADGRIVLEPLQGQEESPWNRDGLYGLAWNGGYARIGRIVDTHPGSVLRELIPQGEPPAAGTEARVDTFVFRGTPSSALGISYEDVSIITPGGEGPAWYVPGRGDAWAIFVHGKGSSREEALRTLPALQELGLHVLIISYRNDAEFRSANAGRYAYGETEWEDVAAAIDYAAGRGGRRFVLIGNSMGGAIAMAVLQQPQYADRIIGVVLDSPVLDLKKTVEFRAAQRNIPGLFTKAALQFASWRNGIDWTKVDYLSRAADLSVPILIFHGDADRTVSIETSEALARARPDLVALRRLRGVDHVQGWNSDRELYRLQLQEFLRRIL